MQARACSASTHSRLPSMNLNDLRAAFTGLTGTNRPIRLRLAKGKGVSNDMLVKHVSGTETICGGIEYCLLCVATHAGLPTKQFIAMPAEIQFVTDSGELRSVCGIVTQATEGQSDGGLATYQLIVRDAMAILEKRTNTRVFRNASEVDITNAILGEWRHKDPMLARAFNFSTLLGNYPARAFTMQWNESDAAFLRRIWKRRGIAWFIEPGKSSDTDDDTPAHTLVLFDSGAALKKNAAGTVRYHRDDGTEKSDSITAWHAVRTLTAGSVTRQSWDYKQARLMSSQTLGLNDQGPLGNQLAASLDDYLSDAPHAGVEDDDYRSLGTLRMQRHEYESKCHQAESGVRDLCIGQWIGVTGHPVIDTHPSQEREFVITELSVEAENNLPKTLGEKVNRLFALNHWRADSAGLEQASAERGARYTNRFTCVRRDIRIVPAYDPRIDLPRTDSINVMVVGPEGEEVYCDEFGRVMVRFPGCRPEDRDGTFASGGGISAHDSAWVRVATSWAGMRYGANSLPRVGTVGRVSFLNGDPDKPVFTSALHGGTTPPPSFSHVSTLPGDRYLSGIVSKEVKGARSNQLRIDDTPGQISIQLASDHAATQLNLGFLTHPRQDGKATPRGDGFELATNQSGSLRTAKSLLISAWGRLNAAGMQLSDEEHVALMQDCIDLFKSLGQYAAEHQGLTLDSAPLAELKDDVMAAAAGGNTDPEGQGAKPTLSLTAPAGIALTTPKTIVNYAGANIDTVAQHNMQLTAGQLFNLNAGTGLGLFSHKGGINAIAHYGTLRMQSQHDGIEVDSAKDVKISAKGNIYLDAGGGIFAKNAAGAYIKLEGAGPEVGGSGPLTVKTNGHNWDGPASGSADFPTFGEGKLARTPRLLRASDGKPVEGMKLHVERDGDGPMSGKTDGMGMGEKIVSDRLQKIKAIFMFKRP